MAFVPNVGQADPAVAFQTKGGQGSLFFAADGVTLIQNPTGPEALNPRLIEAQASRGSELLAAPDLAGAPPAMLRIRFLDRNPSPVIVGAKRLAAEYHYYGGNDPSQWRTHVPIYAGLVYQNLYPGIDLQYNGGRSSLKGTYIVAPQEDPGRIRWRYDGADSVTLDGATGALHITLPLVDRSAPVVAGMAADAFPTAQISEEAPLAWQEIDGQRHPVPVHYVLYDSGGSTPAIGFAVDGYDPAYPLTIDPTLLYSGHIGNDTTTYGNDIATDAAGNVYVTGMTSTAYFYYPLAPPFSMAGNASCYGTGRCYQAYLLKLTKAGSLVYVVEFGGAYQDKINAIKVLADNSVLAVGSTYSLNLPTPNGLHTSPATTDCYQTFSQTPSFLLPGRGSKYPRGDLGVKEFYWCESFVAHFNADGTLGYSTYSGFPERDEALDVARDNQGNIWVAGRYGSDTSPGTSAPYAWELSADGSQQLYFNDFGLGGKSAAFGIAVDSGDNTWVTGFIGPAGTNASPPQGFLLKLDSNRHLSRFRSFGGADYDAAFGIDVDSNDNIYLAGTTCSAGFPALIYNGSPAQGTYGGACDAFVQKYTPAMDLEYSTFLGGQGQEAGLAVAVTGDGLAYVTGFTSGYYDPNSSTGMATDFPTVAALQPFNPYQLGYDPYDLGRCAPGYCWFINFTDAFVTKVDVDGSRFVFSTFLGGEQGGLVQAGNPALYSANDCGYALTIDPEGKVWVDGITYAIDFPMAGNPSFTTGYAYGPMGFMSRIEDNDLPVIFIPGISASELDRQDTGAESWLAIGGTNHAELALYPDRGNPQMFAPDVLRKVQAGSINLFPLSRSTYGEFLSFMEGAGYREYDVNRDPSRRTYAGCDLAQRTAVAPNFFVFAYDWRRPNAETAQLLREYVRCVQEFYPNRKVNLVAHSMGSMVARRYILDFPSDNQVNALITVGGPLFGGPKLLYVLETGDFVPFIASGTLKDMIASFTAAHEIIPGQAWLDLGGLPVVAEDGSDLNGNGSTTDAYDYARLIKLANQRYGSSYFQPGSASTAFRSYQAAEGAQDDWRNDSTGVKYFHIYGVKSVPDTIGQMVAGVETKCDDFLNCYDYLRVTTRLVKGDGTVPELSARRQSSLGNYNQKDAVLVPCESPNGTYDENVEHTALMSNLVVELTIKELLQQVNGGDAQPIPDSINCGEEINTHTSVAAALPQARQPATGAGWSDLLISGVSSLVISDTLGNSTLPISNTVMPGLVPGATDFANGDTSHQITLAGDGAYNLSFQVVDGEPLAIDLTYNDGITITEATRYQDVTLPSGTKARLHVEAAMPATLAYDADGNGSYETTVPPTASLSGSAAGDTTPPEIAFSAADAPGRPPEATTQSVTITAADPGSGLANLYYSLDGTSYQSVAGPVEVDPDVTPVVYAFADDNAANRRPSVAFYVPDDGKPDLAIAVSHPGPTPSTGSMDYVLSVSNTGGAATVSTITLTDTLPVSTTLLSASGTDWSCTPGTEEVVCTHAGPAAAGAALPDLTVSVQLAAGAIPAAINEAAVATAMDWNPVNDHAWDESPIQPVVDLAVAIEHGAAFPANSSGVYTLTVSNLGALPSSGAVVVTDTLPSGLYYQDFDGEGWTCLPSGQDVLCQNTASFAPNGGALPPLALHVYVNSAAYPAVTTTAIVSSSGSADSDLSNNSAVDETPVIIAADLSLYKSHLNGEYQRPFEVGTTDFYDIYVNNHGPGEADGPITVTDTLPPGLTFSSMTGDGWSCNATDQTVTCDHSGPLPAYGNLPGLQIAVDIALDAATVVTNTASLSAAGYDPNPANNTYADPTNTTRYTDMGIVKSHSGDFTAGATGVYTLTVTNYGPHVAAGGAFASDTLPQGMTLASYSGAGWICTTLQGGTNQYAQCSYSGSLPVGTAAPDLVLTVDVSASTAAQVVNYAYVSAQGGYDTNYGNDQAQDPTTVEPAPPPPPEADLSVTISAYPNPAASGQQIDYTVTVHNDGPDVAVSPLFTDVLDSSVLFIAANPPSGSCSSPPTGQSGTVVCQLSDITSGQTANAHVIGNVTAAPRSTITSSVAVKSANPDPDLDDNSATLETEVAPNVCISLADGSWQNPGIWNCGHVPLADDNVIIYNHVTLDSDGEATDLTIELDGHLDDPGVATLTVHGDWTRYDTFTPGSGTVVFDKPGTAILQLNDAASGMETFCNLEVAAGTLFDTGSNTAVSLPGCTVTIAGAVSHSAPYANVDGDTPASLADGLGRQSVLVTQLPGSNDLGMAGATIVAHQAPPANLCAGALVPGTPVLRTFDIDPLFAENVDATVRLSYDPASEANGTNLSQLGVYHCEGGAWILLPGPYVTGAEDGLSYVEVAGVQTFSPFALAQSSPLAVTLASFEAQAMTDHILLTWETVSELDNSGFNLWRGATPTGPDELLAYVPTQAPGSAQGAAYSFADSQVTPGQTLYYWLEDIDFSGATTLHGPVSATLQAPTAVHLSTFGIDSDRAVSSIPSPITGLENPQLDDE